MRVYQMKSILKTLSFRMTIRWSAIVSLALYLPFLFLGLYLSNPHGGLGGYWYFAGLLLTFPMFLYRDFVGYISFFGDWVIALFLEFLYIFLVIFILRCFYQYRKK